MKTNIKILNKFLISGMIFTLVFGTLLHFVYQWSGNNPVVGIFSPVNESVWEHLKLLYYPTSIWVFFYYFKYGKKNPNYLLSSFVGMIVGLFVIPILYYLYTSIAKTNILAVDIIIFIIGIIICFAIFGWLLKNYNFTFLSAKASIALWELVFALFILFTLLPPNLPLFQPPK